MTIDSSSFIKKLLLLSLFFATIYYTKEFLMPLAIGALLATLFLPFSKWMESKNVPRGLAAFLCILSLLLLVTGVGALLSWQISELAKDVSLVKQKAMEVGFRIQSFIFNHLGLSAEEQMEIVKSNHPSVNGVLSMMAGSLTYVLTSFILMMVYILLLLYYRTHINQFLLKVTPPSKRSEMEQIIFSASNVSQQYLLGLSKMIVCLWVMYGISFSIIGVKNAFFFAILCGLLEIIPFIGNITGTAITLLVSTAQGASAPMLGGIVLTYGFVQFIQGWVLEPLIVGPHVKLNSLFTIIALVMGEMMWGIPGIILAIPLMGMFKIVCDHIEPLKPYGFVMGEIQMPKRKSAFINKLKSWFRKKRKVILKK